MTFHALGDFFKKHFANIATEEAVVVTFLNQRKISLTAWLYSSSKKPTPGSLVDTAQVMYARASR